jgi:hypothetical protein
MEIREILRQIRAGVLRRVHLGKLDRLTLERLEHAALTLATPTTDLQPERR